MKQKTCIIFINLKPSHILTYFDVNLLLLVLAELQKTANFVTHLQIAINQDFEEVSKERGSGKDTAACFLQHRNTFSSWGSSTLCYKISIYIERDMKRHEKLKFLCFHSILKI